MKIYNRIIFSVLILSSNMLYSQIKIGLPDYYKGYGVVFEKTDSLGMEISDFDTVFRPYISDIRDSENLLTSFISTNDEKLYSDLTYYYRQYIFYKNREGEVNVLIILLNFKNRKAAKSHFGGWENSMVLGSGEFYDRNVRIFKVNLSEKEVAIF